MLAKAAVKGSARVLAKRIGKEIGKRVEEASRAVPVRTVGKSLEKVWGKTARVTSSTSKNSRKGIRKVFGKMDQMGGEMHQMGVEMNEMIGFPKPLWWETN